MKDANIFLEKIKVGAHFHFPGLVTIWFVSHSWWDQWGQGCILGVIFSPPSQTPNPPIMPITQA
jgi:hypothetical protein